MEPKAGLVGDAPLDTQIERHENEVLEIRRLAQEIWTKTFERDEIRGASLDPELLLPASSPQHGLAPNYDGLLATLLAAFGGERSFAFELVLRRDDVPEVGRCAGSRDLDGDVVHHPERKVSPSILFDASESRRPYYRAWDDHGSEDCRESSLLVLPGISRGKCRLLLAVENRFRDLDISAEKLALFRIYAEQSAWILDFALTSRESDALFGDLTRIRAERERDRTVLPSSEPLSSNVESDRPKASGGRKGLKGDYSMIVGSSTSIVEILQVIDRISTSTAPVLINGESGTGKELVALAVHQNSPRRGKPFVSENCAAITETLLESELFGYVKGAFTGASKDHKGLFEVADGGTLFLDEVGDMSQSMQKKLLRVLQEGVIRRVGAKDGTRVDVRIISATNKDLLAECRQGNFREDLYYRLNVINLKLPPLRDRREDVLDLIRYFLDHASRGKEKPITIDAPALQKLVQYSWPGNIRELQNEIRKLCALAEGDTISLAELSERLRTGETDTKLSGDWSSVLANMTLREATEFLEREMIRKALEETGGNKSLVAKELQIPKTSLYTKIHKYGLA
jgi:DNA-binding NtrC family response regulator